MFAAIKNEFLTYSRKDKFFILAVMLAIFCITGEYAIIRPVGNSLFISSYGSKWFPYAWLATVPLNLLIVSLYHRLLPKWGCWRFLLVTLSIIITGNLFCGFFLKQIDSLPFIFYIWKEIYVMLMLQQVWSLIHSNTNEKRAKYLYGLFFGVGGAGGALASLIPGFFAVEMGSESLLFLTIPLYIVLAICFFYAIRNHSGNIALQEKTKVNFLDSFKLIRSSRFLVFILLLVTLMQVSTTLIEYQFNSILESHVLDKDLRTEYLGRTFGLVNSTTALLQFFGTFLIVHLLGVRGSHILVPAMLGLNALGFFFMPSFGMISLSFITIKSLDFSLFGVIKEMLYIPLNLDEKFRAKAVIDVFAYRSAKAIGSAMILFFQFLPGTMTWLSSLSIIIFLLWMGVARALLRKSPADADIVS